MILLEQTWKIRQLVNVQVDFSLSHPTLGSNTDLFPVISSPWNEKENETNNSIFCPFKILYKSNTVFLLIIIGANWTALCHTHLTKPKFQQDSRGNLVITTSHNFDESAVIAFRVLSVSFAMRFKGQVTPHWKEKQIQYLTLCKLGRCVLMEWMILRFFAKDHL